MDLIPYLLHKEGVLAQRQPYRLQTPRREDLAKGRRLQQKGRQQGRRPLERPLHGQQGVEQESHFVPRLFKVGAHHLKHLFTFIYLFTFIVLLLFIYFFFTIIVLLILFLLVLLIYLLFEVGAHHLKKIDCHFQTIQLHGLNIEHYKKMGSF